MKGGIRAVSVADTAVARCCRIYDVVISPNIEIENRRVAVPQIEAFIAVTKVNCHVERERLTGGQSRIESACSVRSRTGVSKHSERFAVRVDITARAVQRCRIADKESSIGPCGRNGQRPRPEGG